MQNKKRENKKTPKVMPTSGVFCEYCKRVDYNINFCAFLPMRTT